MLLSSSKFANKAQEVLTQELDHNVIAVSVEKIAEGRTAHQKVQLEHVGEDITKGGMMLYTSGTTSRPVRTSYIRHCYCI